MTGLRHLGRLARDGRGAVSIEGAMIIPIIVIFLVGCAEAYFYFRAVGIAEQVAVSTASLVARQPTLNDCTTSGFADPTNLETYIGSSGAAAIIAQPLALTRSGETIVSGVVNPGPASNAQLTVAWQRHSPYAIDGAHSAVGSEGSPASLPASLAATVQPANGDTLIAAEIFYTFTPFPGVQSLLPSLPASVTIVRRAYARARYGNLGTLTEAAACPSSSS